MKQRLMCLLPGMLCLHLALSQPLIRVMGSDDSLTAVNQIVRYLNYQKVREYIHLTVYFTKSMPKGLNGTTFCHGSPEPGAYQFFKVWIDRRLRKGLQELVLAHEMIHVKQYAKQELIVVNDQQVLWKSQKYNNHPSGDYKLAPWERESYRADERMVRLCRKLTEVPLTASRAN